MTELNLSLAALKAAYLKQATTPEAVMASIRRSAQDCDDRNIWIHLLSEQELAPYLASLQDKDPATTPLWGVPFAIKDNIDLAGIPTTAACEAFAYTPTTSATVVQKLLDAGAIPVGKTNLDQFATGLNGTRSPWGACGNSFDPDDISGGSSAGSAVAVALGMASFSLGSDTAGSGRVPAAFNNLVGVKPTIGLLSAHGMVPACRSLDCMSLFALNADDADCVLACAEGFDVNDAYSRRNSFANQSRQYGHRRGDVRAGIIAPDQLAFFGDKAYEQAYWDTLAGLKDDGFTLTEFDYAPFQAAARLLYEGPWVSERYIAASPLIERDPSALFPVVEQIIAAGNNPSAVELFSAQYQLRALKQQCDAILAAFDCIITPTAGTQYRIAQMQEQPIAFNANLGYYTNFMNLLDLSAVAVPTAMTSGGRPFGITLAAPAFSDRALLSLANRIQRCFALPMGAMDLPLPELQSHDAPEVDRVEVVVCGAHMDGLPLNWQLAERGGVKALTTRTAPEYRLYALAGGPPMRPGLVRDEQAGTDIEVEVWSLPASEFGSFVAAIPAPLGIGKLKLSDGRWVSGFICEPYGLTDAREITPHGGWRAYLEANAHP